MDAQSGILRALILGCLLATPPPLFFGSAFFSIVAEDEIVPATAVVSAKVLVAVIAAVIHSVAQSTVTHGEAIPVLALEALHRSTHPAF